MAKNAPAPGATEKAGLSLRKRTYFLKEDQLQKLREEAYRRDVSKGQIVREALDEHFEGLADRLAGALRKSLDSNPAFRERVRSFLEDHAADAAAAEDLLQVIAGSANPASQPED